MAANTMEFKDQLDEYLRENKLTIERFSVMLDDATEGVIAPSYHTIRTWLSGTAIPHPGTQKAIARLMDREVSDLFGES